MIAEVIGIDDVISVVPTLDTNAYASGDRLGSIHTITGAFRKIRRSYDAASPVETGYQPYHGKVYLHSVVIIDSAKQSQPIDILFFNALPTVASADNAAIDISDAEMEAKYIGGISVDEDYISLAANSAVTKRNIGLLVKQSTSAVDNNIYAVPVIRGAGTYAASSLKFLYAFMQD